MPPRISCATVTHTYYVPRHPQSRAPAITLKLLRNEHPCQLFAASRVVAKAPFSATIKKQVDSNTGTGLTPEQRAGARRREQLDTDARALERNFTREWKAGDVYAPHDLSSAEAKKFKKRQSPTTDAFDALSMNPLDCYKASSWMRFSDIC